MFLTLLRREAIVILIECVPSLILGFSRLQWTSEDSREARSLRLLARPFAHGFSAAAKIA